MDAYNNNVLHFRGKGDNFRLGHGSEEHVRHPKQIESLTGKKVINIAIGSMHCVAITEDGELYGWGRNEHGQLGDTSSNCRSVPTVLSGLDGKNIIGASCGPNQVWCILLFCIKCRFYSQPKEYILFTLYYVCIIGTIINYLVNQRPFV